MADQRKFLGSNLTVDEFMSWRKEFQDLYMNGHLAWQLNATVPEQKFYEYQQSVVEWVRSGCPELPKDENNEPVLR